uniref:Importin subunit beta-1/Transportin-1-like TPR repeats domain-containing protein n=1 Tax=Meloidogyne javanica TaxID=6303 RepID=A0A915N5C2_MELJA
GLLRIMGRCTGKESEAVVEEALMAITALIEVLKDGFQKYMPDFKPFLLAALENHDDAQIGIAAVGVVSDLCRAFETNISGYMDEIMERMLGILQDANAKKNVKTQVLNTFGDVALALNAQYSRYLDLNMKWLTEAISAAQITNADDFDQIDYVESLRESCCYAFSGIVQALNGSPESLQLIQRNIQPMLQLIVQISNSQPTTSENLYSSACALAGDLLHSFGVEFLPVVDTAEFGINTLVAKCRRSRTNKAKSIASWVTREIARVKRQAGNAAAAAEKILFRKMDSTNQPGSSKDPNIQWMYDGTKSIVNREDYLLGKKIDRNFELYSDVVVKDKDGETRDNFFKQKLLQNGSGHVHNQKISALDVRTVRNEDPLVALKFQEEQRRRQMLENPLIKLKAQRIFQKEFEKQMKKEDNKTNDSRHSSLKEKEQPKEKIQSRPKLSAAEIEERRKAMLQNASWRDEMRENNFKKTIEELRKEENEANNIPNFIRPVMDSANSSLEKRLQSNKMGVQRSHDHMDKSFLKR